MAVVKSTFDPKDMEYRRLGSAGLQVSVFSFGAYLQTAETVKACFQAAWENGINYFDTAELYGAGDSELVVGQALQDLGWSRDEFVLSTKIFFGTKRLAPNTRGLSKKHIVEGLKSSLQRLQTSYVDIVFAHRHDPEVSMREIVEAFTQAIRMNLAYYWGTSEWTAAQIQEAIDIAEKYHLIAPVVEQPQYHAFHRQTVDKDYENLYREHKLGISAYGALDSGVLTGKYNNGIPQGSRLADQATILKHRVDALKSEEGQVKIQKVKELTVVAEGLGGTVAQLAIAWCAKNPNVSTVILGASRPQQVHENCAALKLLPKLTTEVMKEIEGILANRP